MPKRRESVRWAFVDYIPTDLEEGTNYVAAEFGAVVHRCLEGCGEKVSTPLSPAQWQLYFDGETISLTPSVGNWGLPCKSHYVIHRNTVIWAGPWSDRAVAAAAHSDRASVERHFAPEPLHASRRSYIRQVLQSCFHRR
ncbi:DUF6527 family protein [Leifsonia shinshuensis]|uniref:DUF6527 family protein n=1 Tax=Leifsonia shinshuensis TaxID=150026 RepID=UPI0035A8517F